MKTMTKFVLPLVALAGTGIIFGAKIRSNDFGSRLKPSKGLSSLVSSSLTGGMDSLSVDSVSSNGSGESYSNPQLISTERDVYLGESGVAVAAEENTRDASRIAAVRETTYRGQPATEVILDLTDPTVTGNSYNVQYNFDMASNMWTTDTETMTVNSTNKLFTHSPTKAFYRLKRVD